MKKYFQAKLAILALVALALSGCQGAPAVKPIAAPEPKPAAPAGEPALEIARVFTDNMVIQREVEVPVWGRARPGDIVTVALSERTAQAVAGPDGAWTAKLPPMKAGKAGEMTVSGPGGELKIGNVAVGDVWLCAGQSNMARSVRESTGGSAAAASADYPDVRMFRVQRVDDEDKNSILGIWRPSDKNTVGEFSAVAYFFGLRLYKGLDIPIGLLEASWGGSTAESWISGSAARTNPALAPIMASVATQAEARDRSSPGSSARPPAAKHGQGANAADSTSAPSDTAASTAQPAPATGRPKPPPKPVDWSRYPSKAYDAMIAPIVPFAIRGVVWYQGETNAEDGRGREYRTALQGLIRDWRQSWGNGNLPFLLVQLPAYRRLQTEPSEGSWAEVREAQLLTAESMAKVHLAVAIDLGSANNIHPPNKEAVGSRLALLALEKVYGKKIVGSSPVFESMRIGGSQAVIEFKNVGGGLEARGAALKGFAVAGADRRFAWAEATIDGDKVIVSSEKVARPVAVRYGWADNPRCNLYNREGLPASPFRTDSWPRPSVPADSAAAHGAGPAR